MNSKIKGSADFNDTLHRELEGCTGKFRVSDMYLICEIEPGKACPDQISRFHSVIRSLGWEFRRQRFGRAIYHVYVKGSPSEREVELLVVMRWN
jgi:hypothetical protein